MELIEPRPSRAATQLVNLGLLLACSGIGQAQPQSAANLIKYLTYQSDRPDKHFGMVKGESVVFDCGAALGEARDDRVITKSIVELGDSAVPALEEALSSFEAKGERPEVATKVGWLMLAFARIKGPSAFPVLHRMIGNPRLSDSALGIDNAIALAFGLTSYVSSFRGVALYAFHPCAVPNSTATTLSPTPCVPPSRELPIESFRCDRGEEPRDALDRFVLAWETGNDLSLKASVGPTARSTSDRMPGLKSAGRDVQLGYRFLVPGRWSEPDETLDEERKWGDPTANYTSSELETIFTNSSGVDCGKIRLHFSPAAQNGRADQRYVIDNADVGNLLQLIAVCATDSSPSH